MTEFLEVNPLVVLIIGGWLGWVSYSLWQIFNVNRRISAAFKRTKKLWSK